MTVLTPYGMEANSISCAIYVYEACLTLNTFTVQLTFTDQKLYIPIEQYCLYQGDILLLSVSLLVDHCIKVRCTYVKKFNIVEGMYAHISKNVVRTFLVIFS